jgi:hypothetical protein
MLELRKPNLNLVTIDIMTTYLGLQWQGTSHTFQIQHEQLLDRESVSMVSVSGQQLKVISTYMIRSTNLASQSDDHRADHESKEYNRNCFTGGEAK